MQNIENAVPRTAEAGSKKSLKERALSELEKYAVIAVYLWLLFALFSLHRQLVQGHGISVWHQGLAIVNALIFGKVILIGEALHVGKVLERRALDDSGLVLGSTALGQLRRVLGSGALWSLFLHGGNKRFQLIEY